MYSILQRKNALVAQEALDFAQQLIAVPSPSYQEREVADTIEAKLGRMGFDKVFRDEAGNVAGVLFGRQSEKNLLLTSHMDTAPSDMAQWQTGATIPTIRDGLLYGAGASDCKAGLAAQIYAVELLKRSMLPLEHNLIFAATVAEEQGNSAGIRHLIEKTLTELKLRPDYAVLGEPTDCSLYYGHDGWVEFECLIHTDEHILNRAVQALSQELLSRSTSASSERDTVVIAEPELLGDKARFTINQRIHETDVVTALTEQWQQQAVSALRDYPANVTVQVRSEQQQFYTATPSAVQHVSHAWSIDPFDPMLDKARLALQAVQLDHRPGKWQLGRAGMATAGGALVNDYGIATLGFGPGTETTIHAANESVPVANIASAVLGTAAIVHELIGVPTLAWSDDEI